MINYISSNQFGKGMYVNVRKPTDAFYNGRITNDQANQVFLTVRKPRLDNALLGLYDWFKTTLIKFENDPTSLTELDPRDAKVFNDLKAAVNIPSRDITEGNFIELHDKYWKEHVSVMPDKEMSRYALDKFIINEELVKYKDQQFDLSKPNLIPQISGTQFEKDMRFFVEQDMYMKGLNLTDKFDETSFFIDSYGILHILGVEQDKAKKFSINSTREDAAHCYFASTCNYLVTEDIGLYKRAKILYGVFGVSTKVFKVDEFVDYIDSYLNS